MIGSVVVIGGGTAGVEAAGQLARAGVSVTIIEKEKEVGGHVKNWHHLFPDRRNSAEVLEYLKKQLKHNNVFLITGELIKGIIKRGGSFRLMSDSGKILEADAVVIASGFDLFKCERKEEYGYGIYDNVITSADLELMFRRRAVLLRNGAYPEQIGIVHCVGSRDEKVGNLYCSKLCCVTAVKQAIEIKEHLPESKVFCFYMDMRMGGSLYEEMYREAQEKYGISFIRGKVSEVSENINGKLITKVEDTLAGRPLKIEMDMLILMAGMEMSKEGELLAISAKLKRGENRFFAPADYHFGSSLSNIKGIFYAGTCTAPMNITETISHARGTALDVLDFLRKEH